MDDVVDLPAVDLPAVDLPTVDVAVVGGGVAGLAAALWLGRYRRRVAVLDRGEPRNRWVDELPIEGLAEHLGADVVTCPACDGYESEGADVVVVGGGRHTAGFAMSLLDWAASVTIITDGEAMPDGLLAALSGHGIDVIDGGPTAFLGRRHELRGVTVGGEVVACRRAFLNLGHRPVASLAVALGCAIDEHGSVTVDADGATTVEGVYAAGDCTPGPQLLVVAAAEGSVAGIACARSLWGEPPVADAPPPAPDAEAVLPPASAGRPRR